VADDSCPDVVASVACVDQVLNPAVHSDDSQEVLHLFIVWRLSWRCRI